MRGAKAPIQASRGAHSARPPERQIQSNRIFVTVESLYGFKVALPGGIKRIVKP